MATDWSSSGFPHLLSKALILWDHRVKQGWVFGSDGKVKLDFPDHFYREFSNESQGRSRTDVDAALALFTEDFPSLVDWYGALISPPEIQIKWDNGEPVVLPESIARWEQLANDFDQDALLTLDLAKQYQGASAKSRLDIPERWRTIARVSDHELSVISARGISDLHIHVGGVRLPQLAWQELVTERTNISQFRLLANIYEAAGRDFKSDLENIRKSREEMLALVPDREIEPALPQPTARWWRWGVDVLAPERKLLLATWSRALGRDRAILELLDRYLSHKHRFFSLVRQRAYVSQPGLRQFDHRYFSALRRRLPRDERRRSRNISYGTSKRLEMNAVGDACRYLVESTGLMRIELRIAPLERAGQYLAFFKWWSTLEEHLFKDVEKHPAIRFAVHFKRSKQIGKRKIPEAARKLAELDRQTAALRLALQDGHPRHRWMAALSRIDVAGQERDGCLALFARHLGLLRGDADALSYLEQIGADDPFGRWLQCWERLKRRNQHRPALRLPRLGLTVHAGEDFADLLDGLYQIGTALELVKLQAGDGIGHGLALASDFETNHVREPRYVIMPLGDAHDSLCWLLNFIERHCTGGQAPFNLEPLRTAIRRSAEALYAGLPVPPSSDADDHVWVWRHANFPIRHPPELHGVRGGLLKLQWDERVLFARERTSPADPIRRTLDTHVRWAQAKLLSLVKDKRIVIEMNPSSNLRVSGVASPQHLPTVKLFQAVANGLLACINTDNPGVFTTCIENEYALLLDSACKAGVSADVARGLLERVRQIGMELVYWPNWTGALS